MESEFVKHPVVFMQVSGGLCFCKDQQFAQGNSKNRHINILLPCDEQWHSRSLYSKEKETPMFWKDKKFDLGLKINSLLGRERTMAGVFQGEEMKGSLSSFQKIK